MSDDESGELATEARDKASDEPIEKDVDIIGLARSSEVAPLPGSSYHIGGLDDEFDFGTLSNNSEDFLGEQSGSKAVEELISYSERSSDGSSDEKASEEDSEIGWKVGDTEDFTNVRIEMRNIRYIWQYFIFLIQLMQVLPT